MKIKEIILILAQTLVITAVVLCGVIPFSCKVSTEGIEIIGGDYSAPSLSEIQVIDETTIALCFSEEVNLSSVVVSPKISGISDSDAHSESIALSPALAAASGEYGQINADIEYSEDKAIVFLHLNKETDIGKNYEIFGVVEDRIGNSLTFTVPFSGFNSKIPKMIMTEVQIKYGKGSSGGVTVYRGEFVELLALEDGNLTGLEIVSASDGEKKNFALPNIDVKAGELILVHLRTSGEGCINETEDFNQATAPHSGKDIRDIWSESTESHFNDSSDVIILKNKVDGSIVDGLMYASYDASEWKKGVEDYAVELVAAGIYSQWNIESAASSKGCTTLRSFTRQDSLIIYNTIMNGEEYEFPFPVDEDTWCVEPVTPGYIE